MGETLGSRVRVRWDRPKDRLNPERTEKHLRQILELIVEVRRSFEEAVDVGAYGSRGEQMTLGKGFSTGGAPTESIALAPTRAQARSAAKRAAILIDEARATLQEASDVLFRGVKYSEPEEYAELMEKRSAALGRYE